MEKRGNWKGGRVRVNVTVDPELHRQAVEKGGKFAVAIDEALRAWLKPNNRGR